MNEAFFNLQSQAYEQILDKILKVEYIPGQKIAQKEIEEDLNLGRTPVREALLRLRRDGLIYTVPQSGTFVTKINLDAAFNARFIRENLERKVVVEAALLKDEPFLEQAQDAIMLQKRYAQKGDYDKFSDADDAFHKTFYLATGHAQVWEWLQSINSQLSRFRGLRLKVSDLDWEMLIAQHQEILDAVSNNKPEEADQAAQKHLHLMLAEEQKVVSVFPDYFENIPND